jgi:signal transduction histidine kinase
MTHLVDTLLETSRVARGDLVLVRRDTDLVALVDEVRERYAEAARQNGSSLTLDASERIVGRWDSQRLREAIAQLVGNAVKFGRGSPVTIAVSRDGDGVRVIVTDGGTGVRADDHERIFERFERAVSVRNFAGLGVGLWLAREIARAHGGDVSVESAPGVGAAFTLRLPATAAHAECERTHSRRPRHLRARAAR